MSTVWGLGLAARDTHSILAEPSPCWLCSCSMQRPEARFLKLGTSVHARRIVASARTIPLQERCRRWPCCARWGCFSTTRGTTPCIASQNGDARWHACTAAVSCVLRWWPCTICSACYASLQGSRRDAKCISGAAASCAAAAARACFSVVGPRSQANVASHLPRVAHRA